jgi:hypothetical protein
VGPVNRGARLSMHGVIDGKSGSYVRAGAFYCSGVSLLNKRGLLADCPFTMKRLSESNTLPSVSVSV